LGTARPGDLVGGGGARAAGGCCGPRVRPLRLKNAGAGSSGHLPPEGSGKAKKRPELSLRREVLEVLNTGKGKKKDG